MLITLALLETSALGADIVDDGVSGLSEVVFYHYITASDFFPLVAAKPLLNDSVY